MKYLKITVVLFALIIGLYVLKSGVKKSNLCTMHYMSLPRKQRQTVYGMIPTCPKAVSIP